MESANRLCTERISNFVCGDLFFFFPIDFDVGKKKNSDPGYILEGKIEGLWETISFSRVQINRQRKLRCA